MILWNGKFFVTDACEYGGGRERLWCLAIGDSNHGVLSATKTQRVVSLFNLSYRKACWPQAHLSFGYHIFVIVLSEWIRR